MARRVVVPAMLVCGQLAIVISCSHFKPDDPRKSIVAPPVSDGGPQDASDDADADAVGKDEVVPTVWTTLGDGGVRHEADTSFALLATSPDSLEAFLARADGAVVAAHLENSDSPESAGFEPILPSGSLPLGQRICAICSVEKGAVLFWKREGRTMTAYIDPRYPPVKWMGPFTLDPFGDVYADDLGHVAAVSPTVGGASVFWSGPDGSLRSSYFDPRVEDPRWSVPLPLSAPDHVARPHIDAAMITGGGPIVAYTSPRGAVRVSRFDVQATQPAWLAPTTVAPDNATVAGSMLSVVAVGIGRARLAWVGPGGELRVASFSTRRPVGTGWSEPSVLVRAGSARPGGTLAGMFDGGASVHWFYETTDNVIARVIETVDTDVVIDASARVRRLAGSSDRRPDTGFAVARWSRGISVLAIGVDGRLQLGSPSAPP
jgi:hypothetical protein